MRGPFANEEYVDFSVEENRAAMRAALKDVESQLGRSYPIVIGGERRETGAWIQSINPGNPKQVVGSVAKARRSDAEDAFKAAECAFAKWRYMPAEGRASVLFHIAAILRRRRLELASWMVFELDKAWDEADGEVAEAVDFLEWYGRQTLKLDERQPLAHLNGEATDYRYQPIGIGVVIPPWNFPCAILTGMTIGPVGAGNVVILKPATNTPIIGYKMFEIMEEAGVPAGVVNFLPGSGSEIGDLLVDHPMTRFVAFTGSKDIGVASMNARPKFSPVNDGLNGLRLRWAAKTRLSLMLLPMRKLPSKESLPLHLVSPDRSALRARARSFMRTIRPSCGGCRRADKETRYCWKWPGGYRHGRCCCHKNQFDSIRKYIDIGSREGREVYRGKFPIGGLLHPSGDFRRRSP